MSFRAEHRGVEKSVFLLEAGDDQKQISHYVRNDIYPGLSSQVTIPPDSGKLNAGKPSSERC